MSRAADVERLLRRALAPVDPPEHLAARLRAALQSITAAAGELEGWELAAMRHPRRWLRSAAALVAGAAAGGALVRFGRQRRTCGRSPEGPDSGAPAAQP